jgi:murein DD-endopeptidase MepM/ murein hydrolase activator NlpD
MRRLLFLILLLTLMLWPATAHAQEGPTQYTIQPGDMLTAVAQRFHVPVEVLSYYNDITNPDMIQVGQTLIIPTPAQVQAYASGVRAHDTLAQALPALARGLTHMSRVVMSMFGFREMDIMLARTAPLLTRPAALPLPALGLTAPDAIVQGKTGVVKIRSYVPSLPWGSFQGRQLIFLPAGHQAGDYHYFALLPTGALDEPGPKPLIVHLGAATMQQEVQIQPGIYETQYIVIPESKSDLLAPDKMKAERERLFALWAKVTGPPCWHQPFRFPIAEGFPRTSPYGTRRSYNGGPVSSFHAGSDWGAPEGTPILAPAPGTVVLAEPLFVRGGAVIIDHGAGVYSNFWHFTRIDVKPGDALAKGDQLGLVGTTGLSTGAHLHWEIRINTIAVNPLQWAEESFP